MMVIGMMRVIHRGLKEIARSLDHTGRHFQMSLREGRACRRQAVSSNQANEISSSSLSSTSFFRASNF